MRLKEIEKRLSAIKAEIGNEGADIEALSKETDALLEERKAILEGIEERKATLDKIANGTGAVVETVVKTEERKSFDNSSKEYRSAWLKNIRNMEMNEVEKRAFSSATNSAGAVIPTQTADEIIKKLKQHAPLLGEVTLLQVEGNVTFAVENAKNDATLHTENASISADADSLTKVALTSYEVTKLVQVSKTVSTMSIDSFEAWLTEMIAEKISEKISAFIINGTGSSQPTGVEKAATWGVTNSVSVAKTGTLTNENVQTLIGLLDGVYDKNAKFLMSKKTLFTDFMPLQDKSKNDIVTREGTNYFVHGYPVMLDSNVALHDAYLGDFKKIVANLSEAITITSDFDIKSNSYLFLGCSMFDSKVADDEAFVKLTKADS